MKNKEHGKFNNTLPYIIKTSSIMEKVLNAKIVLMRTEYLIQNMCRYYSYRIQKTDIVLEKKD